MGDFEAQRAELVRDMVAALASLEHARIFADSPKKYMLAKVARDVADQLDLGEVERSRRYFCPTVKLSAGSDPAGRKLAIAS